MPDQHAAADTRWRSARLSLPVLLSLFLVFACAERVPEQQARLANALERGAVAAAATAEPIFFSLEDLGTIAILFDEGPVCGRSDEGLVNIGDDGFPTVVLPGSFAIPSYADRATVFLNGWSARYLDTDHHILEIGVQLYDIQTNNGTLTWKAGGGLLDDGADDGYEFCYTYTVIAWNSLVIHALVDHADIGPTEDAPFHNGRLQGATDTPLLQLSSYRATPSDDLEHDVAILPRGFDLRFGDDHHLLQIAFMNAQSERFLERGKIYGKLGEAPGTAEASRIAPEFLSWITSAILKDNARARPIAMDEQVSLLQGADVSLVSPHFGFVPGRTPSLLFGGGCIGPGAPKGEKSEVFEIHDLPFDYAIPVLSGWELDYGCNDEEVLRLGIWLDEVSYEKEADQPGTLRYTLVSVLEDKDSQPAHNRRHKIDIIGINTRLATDLAPVIFEAPSFCRQDAEGRLLVGLLNTAAGPAPSSTTRVQFPDMATTIDIDTPELAGGFSGDLPPLELPIQCAGGCMVTVEVDADQEITEINENNNVTEGRCSTP